MSLSACAASTTEGLSSTATKAHATTTSVPNHSSTTSSAPGKGASSGTSTNVVTVESFPSPVQQALKYIESHIDLPLYGPTKLNSHGGVLSATTVLGGLGAIASYQGNRDNGYRVNLYYCNSALPLNDKKIPTECNNLASTKGFFSVIAKKSLAIAQQSLPRFASIGSPNNKWNVCPSGSKTLKIENQKVRVCGSQQGNQFQSAVASWHEGDWTFVCKLGNLGTVDQPVEPLITKLNQVLLPPYPGWFGVSESPEGTHSSAAWAVGSTVYQIFDYHSAVSAAIMAASSKSAVN